MHALKPKTFYLVNINFKKEYLNIINGFKITRLFI